MPKSFFEGGSFRGPQDSDVGNRKLIRASFLAVQDQVNSRRGRQHKQPTPEQTNAENFYYLKQMQARTPMVVVLGSGETVHGLIRSSLRFRM